MTRVLQDAGRTFVMSLHESQDDDQAWLTMSLIRAGKNGLMQVHRQISVESVSKESLAAYTAGQSVPNGPGENTETSRREVMSFVDKVVEGKPEQALADHVHQPAFKLHLLSPGCEQDRLEDLVECRRPRPGIRYHGKDDFVAEGNFVAMFSCFDIDRQHFRACDLFRLENGKIVELWDALEPVDPHTVAYNDQT